MPEGQLIRQGAEAKIFFTSWLGKPAIKKRRVPKTYRLPEIDQQLRTRRTREEAKLFIDARKAGVRSPIIYDIDLIRGEITMEKMEGNRVRDILDTLGEAEQRNLMRMIGADIARMHRADIVHGDITTSNMFFDATSIAWIDFGLGEKSSDPEKKAVDLHLLAEVIEATHSKSSAYFSLVIEEYLKHYPQGKRVVEQLKSIERRGRYK